MAPFNDWWKDRWYRWLKPLRKICFEAYVRGMFAVVEARIRKERRPLKVSVADDLGESVVNTLSAGVSASELARKFRAAVRTPWIRNAMLESLERKVFEVGREDSEKLRHFIQEMRS